MLYSAGIRSNGIVFAKGLKMLLVLKQIGMSKWPGVDQEGSGDIPSFHGKHKTDQLLVISLLSTKKCHKVSPADVVIVD